jgi:hypothetical protein
MMYSPAINVYAASIRREKTWWVDYHHHQKKKLLDSLIGWSFGGYHAILGVPMFDMFDP